MITHRMKFAALALSLACSCALARSCPMDYRYTITALPPDTIVSGINNHGKMVGYTSTSEGQRGYVWSRKRFSLIPAATGTTAYATALNNTGMAVGFSDPPEGGIRNAFIHADGVLSLLDVFGSSYSEANAVNDQGQVVGAYVVGKHHRAFIYKNGTAQDLGTLGGSYAAAIGVNRHGHVVGFSNLNDGDVVGRHAFLYADGEMTDLGTLNNGSVSMATASNDKGDITGHAWVDGSEHAFLYRDGVMRDLGTLGGRYSFAFDINNAGHVVGYANDETDSDFFAFLYDGVRMVNLNSLIDPAQGWVLHEARGINNAGQIAAYGCRADLCGGVLLTPRREGPAHR